MNGKKYGSTSRRGSQRHDPEDILPRLEGRNGSHAGSDRDGNQGQLPPPPSYDSLGLREYTREPPPAYSATARPQTQGRRGSSPQDEGIELVSASLLKAMVVIINASVVLHSSAWGPLTYVQYQ